MSRFTHWRCYKCKQHKKLGTEILRADMYAICLDCQRGTQPTGDTTSDVGRGAEVAARVRGRIVRKHSTDNRD